MQVWVALGASLGGFRDSVLSKNPAGIHHLSRLPLPEGWGSVLFPWGSYPLSGKLMQSISGAIRTGSKCSQVGVPILSLGPCSEKKEDEQGPLPGTM